ncbi:hypothetical protein [Kordiimonas aquimaris]|uniref:hypothetical protein n=1 Tax=Kordiimonas aquimaris TaxID=707591 RepID=UPI0021D301CB|nr:hypothetical protein [Kordiimonas aquimaris]
MLKTTPILVLYCVTVLLCLGALMLWPTGTQRLLVVVPQGENAHSALLSTADQYAFSMIAGTSARVVDQVSSNSFIIATPENVSAAFVRHLYGAGALVVVNAAGDFGCVGTQKPASFRRELS